VRRSEAEACRPAFEKAAKRVKNNDGKSGRVKFKAETDYYPFCMKESLPVVKRAVAAVSGIGGTPEHPCREWRARRELDGPPRCSDRDLRRRTERGAHDRRVDQSRRVRPSMCARRIARDDAVSLAGSGPRRDCRCRYARHCDLRPYVRQGRRRGGGRGASAVGDECRGPEVTRSARRWPRARTSRSWRSSARLHAAPSTTTAASPACSFRSRRAIFAAFAESEGVAAFDALPRPIRAPFVACYRRRLPDLDPHRWEDRTRTRQSRT